MAKNKSIDIKEAFTHFFALPDWKTRCIYLGIPTVITLFFYFISTLFMLIPIVGIFVCAGSFLLMMILLVIYGMYISGYSYEIAEAVLSDKAIEDIKVNENIKGRISIGFRLLLASLVYAIPIIILYIIGYAMIFLPMILLGVEEGSDGPESTANGILSLFSIILMFVGYIPLILTWVYQIFLQFFIFPAIMNQYIKYSSFESLLSFRDIWKFIKANFINLLIYFAVMLGSYMLFSVATWISMALILLCVGLILLPILMAVFTSYFVHLQGYMIGNIIKLSKD